MAPKFHPWITRIDPNHGLLTPALFPFCRLTQSESKGYKSVAGVFTRSTPYGGIPMLNRLLALIHGKKDSRAAGR